MASMNQGSVGALQGPRWWVAGDLNGFFGLFTNILLNVIVLTGLCIGLVQMPADLVYSRILPALGIALALGYAIFAVICLGISMQAKEGDGK